MLILESDDAPSLVDDQSTHAGLKLHAHTLSDGDLPQWLDDVETGKRPPVGPMSPLRRPCVVAIRREGLVPRVVEVILVRRIRGLDRTQGGQKRNAPVGHPSYGGCARLAEVPERLFRYRVLHLHR